MLNITHYTVIINKMYVVQVVLSSTITFTDGVRRN